MDEGADPEASNEVPSPIHLGTLGGTSEKPPGYSEGLSGRDAEGAIQFLGQKQGFQQSEGDTALYPLSTCWNGLRTDSKQKIVEGLTVHLQYSSSGGGRNGSQLILVCKDIKEYVESVEKANKICKKAQESDRAARKNAPLINSDSSLLKEHSVRTKTIKNALNHRARLLQLNCH